MQKVHKVALWLRSRNYTWLGIVVLSACVMSITMLITYQIIDDKYCDANDKKSFESKVCTGLSAATTVAIYLGFMLTIVSISSLVIAHRCYRHRPSPYLQHAEL